MGKLGGWMKGILGAVFGLFSGAGMMYLSVIVDQVVKPAKPVANFAVSTEGLTATFQNQSSGQTGWWDYGDGTPLEPYDPNQQTVTHAYSKSGSYSAKLTVRNFLMEENSRTVPVDLSAAVPQNLPMSIAGLKVEPVGPQSIAPATFRVRGEVQNAEKAILDLGDGKPEVITENGPFDKFIVIEKPGQFPIKLTGLNGKSVVQKSEPVTVTQPTAGMLSVILRVSDTGSRSERRETNATIPVPVPAKGAKAEKGFEKSVQALAGYTISEARLGKVTSPAVKNLKAEVAADKRSVKLTGEWTHDSKSAGSDVMMPLTLVQERTATVNSPTRPTSAAISPGNPVEVPLPPAPAGMTNSQRKLALEFRQASVTGQSVPIHMVPDLKLPWTESKTYPNVGTYVYKAEAAGDKVRLTVTVQPATR